ncbi:hypothetical protein INT48_007109 [Thamnidium elegans]|uniref:RGS domain-containing protein n=1 Tax=Thamnidium elegans TaxID=101142 RepID=A0A8H7SR14_9FUNG|nr:hypothetical protein INT48_007109 [Thamnidium elegans]
MMNLAQKAFSGFYSTNDLNGPDGLTLEMVLSNTIEFPFRLQDFSDYLTQTYCNENLLFYQSVVDYKEKCNIYFNFNNDQQVLLVDGISLFDFTSNQAHLLSPKEATWFQTLKDLFEIILSTFILNDAPQEINLPYEIRHQLLQSYQLQQSYHPILLYPACTAIIELLRISAFIPFATDPNRLSLYQKKLSSTQVEPSFLKSRNSSKINLLEANQY